MGGGGVKQIIFFRKTILPHFMFSLCFTCMLFPKLLKPNLPGGGGGGGGGGGVNITCKCKLDVELCV